MVGQFTNYIIDGSVSCMKLEGIFGVRIHFTHGMAYDGSFLPADLPESRQGAKVAT